MNFFANIYQLISNYVPYVEFEGGANLRKWQSRLLHNLCAYFIIFGFILYILSTATAIAEKKWGVLIVNTIAYIVAFFIIGRKTSANFKALSIISISSFIGIAILLLLGFKGAGFLWLLLPPVMAAIFFEKRGLWAITILNIIIFGLLSLTFISRVPDFLEITNYGVGAYFVVVFNFMFLSFFVSLSLSVMVKNINKSLEKEANLIEELREKQEILEIEKQRAQESDRLKSAFLSNLSHEIRTPMNAIVGFSTFLNNKNLTEEEIAQYTNIIQDSSNQLLSIIDDILDISKIQSNQVVMDYEPTDICAVLSEIEHVAKYRILINNKDLKVNVIQRKHCIVNTDRAKLKQILTKLVYNAIKFTDSGTIEIGLSSIEGAQDYIEFYIKDTGKGIDKKTSKLIFQQFVKGDSAQHDSGIGLGLSIANGLVRLLEGKLWFESEVNKGTTFYFTIPNIPNISFQ